MTLKIDPTIIEAIDSLSETLYLLRFTEGQEIVAYDHAYLPVFHHADTMRSHCFNTDMEHLFGQPLHFEAIECMEARRIGREMGLKGFLFLDALPDHIYLDFNDYGGKLP